jgi:hypothetical protein
MRRRDTPGPSSDGCVSGAALVIAALSTPGDREPVIS